MMAKASKPISMKLKNNCVYLTFYLPNPHHQKINPEHLLIEKSARKHTKILTEVVCETWDNFKKFFTLYVLYYFYNDIIHFILKIIEQMNCCFLDKSCFPLLLSLRVMLAVSLFLDLNNIYRGCICA